MPVSTWHPVRTCPRGGFLSAPGAEEHTPVAEMRLCTDTGRQGTCGWYSWSYWALLGLCFHHHKMGLLFPTPVITVRMKIVYVKQQMVPELKQTNKHLGI